MQFPTVSFTLFFLVVLAVWWALPAQAPVARRRVLIAASLLFYAASGVGWLLVLGAVAAVAWGTQTILSRTKLQGMRMMVGWTGVLLLVGNLAAWKYTQWLVESHNVLAQMWGWTLWPLPEWAYPVGLSFFTFHALAIVCDVWHHRLKPYTLEQTIAQVSFFPCLLAGPVLRSDAVAGRLDTPFVFARIPWVQAVGMIMLGMTFKWVLATQAAAVADPVFQGLAESGAAVWWGAHAYGAQIFFDFAGYSLMALGLALMLGFSLPDNFTQPYLATSAKEFWSSWHRSLSFFFRDHVYIGLLGGNQHGAAAAMGAAALTMILSGLWHGANMTFFVWGVWHATWLVAERLIPNRAQWPSWVGWIVSLEVVMWGWVWFRADDVDSAVSVFAQAFSAPFWPTPDAWPSFHVWAWTIVGVGAVCAERSVLRGAAWAQEHIDRPRQWIAQTALVLGAGGWAAAVVWWGPVGVPPFIYNGF